jgi:hypothetical protein
VGLRVLLTFLVPLAFAATVPAQAIAGLATGRTLLAAVAFTAALTTLTRWAWKQGLPLLRQHELRKRRQGPTWTSRRPTALAEPDLAAATRKPCASRDLQCHRDL